MRIVREAESSRALDPDAAYRAVERAFVAAASGSMSSVPPVLAHGPRLGTRFSIKAASCPDGQGPTGLKIGSYWPDNVMQGLPPHAAVLLLIDTERGGLSAVIEATRVNALRTAAADAVAASWLSRPESETIAVFGAGHQASFEVEALRRIRPIRSVIVVNRDRTRAERLAARLGGTGLAATVASAEAACRDADIIVTVTAAREPLFEAGWVRPGTHVASMGSDGPGKQELPLDLLTIARLFADLPEQSVRFGEFQHVAAAVSEGLLNLTPLGSVISGAEPGRTSPDEITVFDSSGLAIQDLFIAQAVLDCLDSASWH